MTRTVITVLAGASAVFVIGALFSVFHIFNDINGFYEDALRELEDFKVFFNKHNKPSKI